MDIPQLVKDLFALPRLRHRFMAHEERLKGISPDIAVDEIRCEPTFVEGKQALNVTYRFATTATAGTFTIDLSPCSLDVLSIGSAVSRKPYQDGDLVVLDLRDHDAWSGASVHLTLEWPSEEYASVGLLSVPCHIPQPAKVTPGSRLPVISFGTCDTGAQSTNQYASIGLPVNGKPVTLGGVIATIPVIDESTSPVVATSRRFLETVPQNVQKTVSCSIRRILPRMEDFLNTCLQIELIVGLVSESFGGNIDDAPGMVLVPDDIPPTLDGVLLDQYIANQIAVAVTNGLVRMVGPDAAECRDGVATGIALRLLECFGKDLGQTQQALHLYESLYRTRWPATSVGRYRRYGNPRLSAQLSLAFYELVGSAEGRSRLNRLLNEHAGCYVDQNLFLSLLPEGVFATAKRFHEE